MVQYIVTPWRTRQQLLEVRRVFYPPPSDPISEKEKKNAVALVSVWVQRGNCPHLVESTALLVSTRLTDDTKNSAYAVRAAYAAAFGRYVLATISFLLLFSSHFPISDDLIFKYISEKTIENNH
jgi:ribosomal biogenesis protein LAS1